MKPTAIAERHLVLLGGGHTHALVLKALAMRPEPGLVVTVVAKEIEAPYSGMLPGFVAGHYTHAECHIDLVRLTHAAGARLVHGAAIGIDRASHHVLIEGRPPLGYDVLSINIGIVPKLDDIAGAAEHAVAVKPVSTFIGRWQAVLDAARRPDAPKSLAVIGTGAAGFELALAIRHRLGAEARAQGRSADPVDLTLIGGNQLLATLGSMAQRHARRALGAARVTLIENDRVVRITSKHLETAGGRRLAADAVLLATAAAPAAWLAQSGLPVDERGFVAVRPTLQVLDDENVFAAGDCATVLAHRREKAGVFAVRQAVPLLDNLRRRLRGEATLPFAPQVGFLTLLSTGDRHAIGVRNGFAFGGRWVWRLKDRIDRAFMEGFEEVFQPMSPASGGLEPRCAGCAAKVGPVTLARALDRLDGKADSELGRDDVAIVDTGGPTLRLETIDFFRAPWPEPYVFGEIVAHHAMGDILAKGGTPTRALANIVLPHAASARTEEDLFQVLAGIRAALATAGAQLIGGHTSEGSEIAAGLSLTGEVPRSRLIAKRGVRPGDRLILTRPLGSGLLFAALMRGRAQGAALAAVLAVMRSPAIDVARAIVRHEPSAATDVTGFGLCGHLLEMLGGGQAAVALDLGTIPTYPTALALARSGIGSTLLPENLRLARHVVGAAASESSTLAVLFDPQTAGGFLLAVPPERAEACIADLRSAGATAAAIIGTARPKAADSPAIELSGALASPCR